MEARQRKEGELMENTGGLSSVGYGSATAKVLAKFPSNRAGVARTTGTTTAGGQRVTST